MDFYGRLPMTSHTTVCITTKKNNTVARSLQIHRLQSLHALRQLHAHTAVVSQLYHFALLAIEGNCGQGMQLNSVTDGEAV